MRQFARRVLRTKYWLVAACTLAMLAGCAQVKYYMQAAQGQYSLWSDARPIDDWLGDPATDPQLKARLEKALLIRRFAVKELGLPDNASYKNYAALSRPFVLWNVVATPELSLRPIQWCFPIAGCVSYRGYYSKDDAMAYADELRGEGNDVQVGGVPQIEVTFDIDANGIVNVSAKDKGTGKEQQNRIQASGGLSDADIDQMVKDAERFAEEDKKRRAGAEAKNNAESLIHTTERQLADNGDKVDDSLKSEIQSAIDAAKAAVEGGDADQMNEKAQALAQVAMKLGQAIYEKSQAAEASPQGDAGAEAPKDDVVDAEFSEVDDHKA